MHGSTENRCEYFTILHIYTSKKQWPGQLALYIYWVTSLRTSGFARDQLYLQPNFGLMYYLPIHPAAECCILIAASCLPFSRCFSPSVITSWSYWYSFYFPISGTLQTLGLRFLFLFFSVKHIIKGIYIYYTPLCAFTVIDFKTTVGTVRLLHETLYLF